MASISPCFVQFMPYLTKRPPLRRLSKANGPYACPPLSLNLFTFGRPYSPSPTFHLGDSKCLSTAASKIR